MLIHCSLLIGCLWLTGRPITLQKWLLNNVMWVRVKSQFMMNLFKQILKGKKSYWLKMYMRNMMVLNDIHVLWYQDGAMVSNVLISTTSFPARNLHSYWFYIKERNKSDALTVAWESGTAVLKSYQKEILLSQEWLSQPGSNWQTGSLDQMAQIFSNLVLLSEFKMFSNESHLADVTA